MNSITTNTSISIAVLALILGGVLWLTNIDASVKVNKRTLENNSTYMSKVYYELKEMNTRLSNIEGKLEANQ